MYFGCLNINNELSKILNYKGTCACWLCFVQKKTITLPSIFSVCMARSFLISFWHFESKLKHPILRFNNNKTTGLIFFKVVAD